MRKRGDDKSEGNGTEPICVKLFRIGTRKPMEVKSWCMQAAGTAGAMQPSVLVITCPVSSTAHVPASTC